MYLQFVVLLMCVSAKLCASSRFLKVREFAVHNCTACVTRDEWWNITIAKCENQTADKEVNATYVCKCLSITATRWEIQNFPRHQGNATRCSAFKYLYTLPWYLTAVQIVGGCMCLYAATHAFYVVVVSGMCSCERCRCTKHNTSTLIMGISALCSIINTLVYSVLNGVFGMYDISTTNLVAFSHTVRTVCAPLAASMSLVLLATSISDMVFHGEDMACRRRCITIVCWTLFIVAILGGGVGYALGYSTSPVAWMYSILIGFASAAMGVVIIISTVLIVIAHCRMNKVEFASYLTHLIYNYHFTPKCLRR